MCDMAASPCIQCRVDPQTKTALRTLAERQGVTESALLKRLVELMLQTANAAQGTMVVAESPAPRDSRLSIRIAPDDQRLLRERARARGIPAATYLSILARVHLRGLAPLPRPELLALERSVSELGRIGRNINQIARAANQGDRVSAPGHDDLMPFLQVCKGLRDHVKALLQANLRSWRQGYADQDG
jgi:predicted DNA binding CopG/RHH family protein